MVSNSTNLGAVFEVSIRLKPRSSKTEEEASDWRWANKCWRHVSDSATASSAIAVSPPFDADAASRLVEAAAGAAAVEGSPCGKKWASRAGDADEGEADFKRPCMHAPSAALSVRATAWVRFWTFLTMTASEAWEWSEAREEAALTDARIVNWVDNVGIWLA